ncbi:MAG: histidine kinase, partial [Comamonas sp.]
MPLAITVVTSAAMSFVFYLIGTSRHLQMRAAQAEHQAAQARLTLLQTQLEPHMLFNTLANLRVLIAADPQRAQTMLDHLIDYLRATLGNSRSSVHSLCEEFARLQDYLALMQIRMGPRLTFTLELPLTLVNVPLPPLLLQPLVENSHVAARQIASDHGHAVELTVRDTGQGLSAGWEAMASETPGTPHFGTAQVRERLATWYGGAATFALSAAPQPPGTLARI